LLMVCNFDSPCILAAICHVSHKDLWTRLYDYDRMAKPPSNQILNPHSSPALRDIRH
jgi:hypothetical protein